jgi:hypothetical protein
MEVLLLVGSIIGAGYILNKKSENIRNVSINDTITPFPDSENLKIEEPNSTNIYNSNFVNAANDTVLQKSLQNYKAAENPSITTNL